MSSLTVSCRRLAGALLAAVLLASSSIAAAESGQSSVASKDSRVLPAGAEDILRASPTLLDMLRSNTLTSGNKITISGSKLIFVGRTEREFLIRTIKRMLVAAKSDEDESGLVRMVAAVLDADSDATTRMGMLIRAAVACRTSETMLDKCVTAAVDAAAADAMEADDETPKDHEAYYKKTVVATPRGGYGSKTVVAGGGGRRWP